MYCVFLRLYALIEAYKSQNGEKAQTPVSASEFVAFKNQRQEVVGENKNEYQWISSLVSQASKERRRNGIKNQKYSQRDCTTIKLRVHFSIRKHYKITAKQQSTKLYQ